MDPKAEASEEETAPIVPVKDNELIFRNVSFTTKYKYGEQKDANGAVIQKASTEDACIIRDVSAKVRSRETLCIMGPSGAGKTTLLNVLTQNADYGTTYGEILLNGEKLTKERFAEQCAVVPQFDDAWGHLTVYESLLYAAKLFANPDPEKAATELMGAMGLNKCKDTKVGDELTKGISGGQKKRLCVCMALMKKPAVMFLDEPTSGLDAASATHTTNFMMDLAAKYNIILVATIHQPSTVVFRKFKQLLLMSRGRPAYYGMADVAVNNLRQVTSAESQQEFFDTEVVDGHESFTLKEGWADAEYLLDVINADFIKEDPDNLDADPEEMQRNVIAAVDVILDKCQKELDERANSSNPELNFNVTETHKLEPRPVAGFLAQYYTLTSRQFYLSFRNPSYFHARVCATLLFLTVVQFVFWEFHAQTQFNSQKWVWLLCVTLFVSGAFTMSAVVAHFFSLQVIVQEMKNGMVHKGAYFLATLQLMFAVGLVIALLVTLPSWVVFGLHWNSYFPCLCLIWMCLVMYDLVAFTCAFISEDRENGYYVALAMYNVFFWVSLFSSAIFQVYNDVWWPARVTILLNPMTWWVSAASYLIFIDTTWEQAYYCALPDMEGCFYNSGDLAGWRCDDDVLVCRGYTGEQVITSLGKDFGGNELIKGKSRLVRDVFCLFGLLLFWLTFAATMVSKLNTTELKIEADKLDDSKNKTKTLCECRDKDNGANTDTKSTVGLAASVRESLTKSAAMDADDTTSLTIPESRKEKERTAFEWSNLHFKIPGADRLDQDQIDWCKHKVDTAKDDTAKDIAKKQLEVAMKHDKHIIQGCSGKLVQGQALCILGPSGAGKTSLLNMMTLEAHGGKSYGSVKFNDEPISTEILSTYCGVVRQFEATWPHLSAKEALLYSISLYEDMDGTSAEIAERKSGLVSDALLSMGLTACMDTRFDSLSGGQKKRLAVAMVLLKRPKVLFLDEPTTGLDSASADHVMQHVFSLGKTQGIITIATVHQPSNRIFKHFDQLLLLAAGRCAYYGPAYLKGRDGELLKPIMAASVEFFGEVMYEEMQADHKMTNDELAEIEFYKSKNPDKAKQLERIYDPVKRKKIADDTFDQIHGGFFGEKTEMRKTYTSRLDVLTSPAEFILDAINPDFVPADSDEQVMEDSKLIRTQQVTRLLDAWGAGQRPEKLNKWLSELIKGVNEKNDEGKLVAVTDDVVPAKLKDVGYQTRPSFAKLYACNIDLVAKDFWRRPAAVILKLAGSFALIFYLAMLSVEQRDYNQTDLEGRIKMLNIMTQFAAAAAPIVTVIKGFADSKIVESQVRNGMPCQSYTFALLSLEIPVFAFTAAVPLFFCGFLISNYEWKALFPMMLCSILYQTALEGQAHISSLRKVFAIGLIEYINFWMANFFFCGLGWGRPDVNWPFKIGFYVHPGFWMNKAITWAWLRWADYEGATIEGCETADVADCNYNFFHGEPYLPGWKCPDQELGAPCFGATGIQVLDSLHKDFDYIDSDDHFGMDIGILCGFIGLMFFGYNMEFFHRCKENSEFEKEDEAEKKEEHSAIADPKPEIEQV